MHKKIVLIEMMRSTAGPDLSVTFAVVGKLPEISSDLLLNFRKIYNTKGVLKQSRVYVYDLYKVLALVTLTG